jgi:cyclophilin family peptidyl-prolyl cis-trans isomerase
VRRPITLTATLAGVAISTFIASGALAAGLALQWSQPPRMTINTRAHYTATVKTTDGTFTIALLPRTAPITVNNFVFLAEHHFYDNVVFHRIIKTFMVQTGDPTGTGAGGPGYTFKDERVTMAYTQGIVAMANAGPNTNGSQFFIVVEKKAPLQPAYTIFGKVASGMSVVLKIAGTRVGPSPTGELSHPLHTIKMLKVTIHESK